MILDPTKLILFEFGLFRNTVAISDRKINFSEQLISLSLPAKTSMTLIKNFIQSQCHNKPDNPILGLSYLMKSESSVLLHILFNEEGLSQNNIL